MKAYKCDCEDDDHGAVVVFAARGKDVSRYTNSETCDCEFIDKHIRRAPEFDRYAPGPVTVPQYLAEGWHWECSGCSRLVYGDDSPLVSDCGHVYHNIDCVRLELNRWTGDDQTRWHPSVHDFIAATKRLLEAEESNAEANTNVS